MPERYDLVVPETTFADPRFQALLAVIRSLEFQKAAAALGGYDLQDCGVVLWNNDVGNEGGRVLKPALTAVRIWRPLLMSIKLLAWIMLYLGFSAGGGLPAASLAAPDQPVTIYLFWTEGCLIALTRRHF